MNTKNAERYETELGDRETVLTGNVIALPTEALHDERDNALGIYIYVHHRHRWFLVDPIEWLLLACI